MTTHTYKSTLENEAHQTTKSTGSSLLRNAMRANAIFCGGSAALFLLASAPIAEFLGIAETNILGIMSGVTFISVIGVLLAFNAGELFFVTSRLRIPRWQAWGTIALDVLWVAISVELLLTNTLPFTTADSWAVLVVADVVLGFAIVQYVGLRRYR